LGFGERGIRTAIVHGGGGGLIAGTGPSLELHVDARETEEMNAMEDEIADEISSERPYECPKCCSENYAPRQAAADGFVGFLSVLMGRNPRMVDDEMLPEVELLVRVGAMSGGERAR
jgi:hypothetical protein